MNVKMKGMIGMYISGTITSVLGNILWAYSKTYWAYILVGIYIIISCVILWWLFSSSKNDKKNAKSNNINRIKKQFRLLKEIDVQIESAGLLGHSSCIKNDNVLLLCSDIKKTLAEEHDKEVITKMYENYFDGNEISASNLKILLKNIRIFIMKKQFCPRIKQNCLADGCAAWSERSAEEHIIEPEEKDKKEFFRFLGCCSALHKTGRKFFGCRLFPKIYMIAGSIKQPENYGEFPMKYFNEPLLPLSDEPEILEHWEETELEK